MAFWRKIKLLFYADAESRINFASFKATLIVGVLVLSDVILGKIDASIICKP